MIKIIVFSRKKCEKVSNLTFFRFFATMLLFLFKGGTMKKVTKVSFALGSLGILMIFGAILLQYKSFKNVEKKDNSREISMKDVESGTEEVIEEPSVVVDDTEITEITEEGTGDQEIEEVQGATVEEVTTPVYDDVTTIPVEPIVYDNMTMRQLAEKLNRSLKSTISGQGYLIASYSLELGIDPYLATAIILHETGCNSGTCSSLVRSCNNVGGQKGGPSCGRGAYKAYPTLEEGIKGYLDNLYRNYISHGLTTAEAIGPKYAASTTWASQVNGYIALVRNK